MDLMPMSMRMMLTLDLEIFKKGVLSQEELSLEMKSISLSILSAKGRD
jgi:hypothetical protein